MPDKEKDSDRKIRDLASEIVNELLKTGEPLRIDISSESTIAKCGPRFGSSNKYTCSTNFVCTGAQFECTGKFKDSKDYTLTVG
jgi:hypothetical protein